MTPSQLKYEVEAAGHERHFFDRKTMKFFCDTMKNYGVRERLIQCDYDRAGNYVEGGTTIKVWELYRKHPVKHGLQKSAFFDAGTFERVLERSE